jgi:hypothetical protein
MRLSWKDLQKISAAKVEEAFILGTWILTIPPLAPQRVTSLVLSMGSPVPMSDPVVETYLPDRLSMTTGKITLHFFRKKDAERVLDMALAVRT